MDTSSIWAEYVFPCLFLYVLLVVLPVSKAVFWIVLQPDKVLFMLAVLLYFWFRSMIRNKAYEASWNWDGEKFEKFSRLEDGHVALKTLLRDLFKLGVIYFDANMTFFLNEYLRKNNPLPPVFKEPTIRFTWGSDVPR